VATFLHYFLGVSFCICFVECNLYLHPLCIQFLLLTTPIPVINTALWAPVAVLCVMTRKDPWWLVIMSYWLAREISTGSCDVLLHISVSIWLWKRTKEGDCFWLIHGLDTSSFLSGITYENCYAVHHRVLSANIHRMECNVRKHWFTTTYTAVMMCVSNNLAQM
jgi:hypothetical protein